MGKSLKAYYNRLKTFKRFGYDMKGSREFILDKAALDKGPVLEIGTGKGHTALGLARRGIRFTTVDLDAEAMTIARSLLREERLGRYAAMRKMNAEKLSFGGASFDHVISVNFMHHAKRPEECLKEMARVAKRTVVIADLNKRGEKIMEKVHRLDGCEHEKSAITFPEMSAFLKARGFRVKKYRDRCQTVLVAKKG